MRGRLLVIIPAGADVPSCAQAASVRAAALYPRRTLGTACLLLQLRATDADQGNPEEVIAEVPLQESAVHLRVTVRDGAHCTFAFRIDGSVFTAIGEVFRAREGRWVGAKVGIHAVAPPASSGPGHADFEFFRVEPVSSTPVR